MLKLKKMILALLCLLPFAAPVMAEPARHEFSRHPFKSRQTSYPCRSCFYGCPARTGTDVQKRIAEKQWHAFRFRPAGTFLHVDEKYPGASLGRIYRCEWDYPEH